MSLRRAASIPLLVLPLMAASPVDTSLVRERTARVKTLFLGQPTCTTADRKACTKSCTAAALKPYRYDTSGAADCEVMGDIWANGLADLKKPMPAVGLKSYEDACALGQATACEKEAAHHEAAGDHEKALQIRLAACLMDYEPACLAAAKTVADHGLPYASEVPTWEARGHVHACDVSGEAASCAWLDAHAELARARRDEVNARRETELATVDTTHGAIRMSTITDPTPYLDTHRVVWTTHPARQDPETGAFSGRICHEVYIPLAARRDVALAATFAHALLRRDTLVQPSLIDVTLESPRSPHAGCEELVTIAVQSP